MWNMIQGSTCSFTLCIILGWCAFTAVVLARATKSGKGCVRNTGLQCCSKATGGISNSKHRFKEVAKGFPDDLDLLDIVLDLQ